MSKLQAAVLVIASAALVSLAFAQQQPAPVERSNTSQGRYQMKLATSDLGNATVNVIDTTTSQVWQYNRSGQNWLPLGQPDKDQ